MVISVRLCVLCVFMMVFISACAVPEPVSRPERPENVTAEDYFNDGLRDLKRGDLEGAVEDFEKAIRIKPNYVDAFYYLGQAYEQMRMPGKAERAYLDCIGVDSRYTPAREALGLLLFGMKRYEEAVTQLEVAARLRSVLPEVYFTLGEIYMMEKECRKALDAYREAVRLDPGYRVAREGLDATERVCKPRKVSEKPPKVEKSFTGGGKAIDPDKF